MGCEGELLGIIFITSLCVYQRGGTKITFSELALKVIVKLFNKSVSVTNTAFNSLAIVRNFK